VSKQSKALKQRINREMRRPLRKCRAPCNLKQRSLARARAVLGTNFYRRHIPFNAET
jgi:hypothetical protein